MKTSIILAVICFVAGMGVNSLFVKRPDTGLADSGAAELIRRANPANEGGSGSGEMSVSSGGGSRGDGRISLEDFLELFDTNRGGGKKVYDVLATMDVNTVQELLTGLFDPSLTDRRQWSAQQMLLSHYAEVDSQGAMNYIFSISNTQMRRNAIRNVMAIVGARDFQQGLIFLQSLDNKEDKQQAINALAGVGEPEEVLALLKREGLESQNSWSYQGIFQRLAEKDPQAAIARIEGLPFGQIRNSAMQGIAASMAQTDPDAGLAWASGLSRESERWQATRTILSTLSATDPRRALALLDEHADAKQKKEMLGTIAQTWMANDPNAARVWMEALPEKERMVALSGSSNVEDPEWVAQMLKGMPLTNLSANFASNLARNWAQTDPTATAKWIDSLPPGRAQQNALQGLMYTWAERDPVAAARYLSADPSITDSGVFQTVAQRWITQDSDATLAWVEGLDVSDKIRDEVVQNMMGSWVQQDPDAAADYVLGLDGERQKNGIENLASNWASQDPDKAIAWVQSLDDEALRDSALRSVIQNIGYNDSDRAGELLMGMAGGTMTKEKESELKNTAGNVARQMAENDPSGAAEWVSRLPEMMGRAEAVNSVANTWAQYDPMAASEWVSTFQNGPERDSAVSGLVNSIGSQDPESAFIWAMSIGQDSTRVSAVNNVIREWKGVDRDAAISSVTASALDEQTKQRLLKSLEQQATFGW